MKLGKEVLKLLKKNDLRLSLIKRVNFGTTTRVRPIVGIWT